MIYIIAGDEYQAERCAAIKGAERGEWKRIASLGDIRGRRWDGITIYAFGTFRTRHMFEWREMMEALKHLGGKCEQVIDGRLTG